MPQVSWKFVLIQTLLARRARVHLESAVEASGQSASEATGTSSSAVEVLLADAAAVAAPAVPGALLLVLEDDVAAAGVLVVPVDTPTIC